MFWLSALVAAVVVVLAVQPREQFVEWAGLAVAAGLMLGDNLMLRIWVLLKLFLLGLAVAARRQLPLARLAVAELPEAIRLSELLCCLLGMAAVVERAARLLRRLVPVVAAEA